MSAETELHDALNAFAPLTAVVVARIYPDFLTQDIVLPAIVYQRSATEYVTTIHSGAVLDKNVTMEVWCMANTRLAAETLASLVEQAIAAPVNSFLPVDRRPEFDEPTLTFSTVVTCTIWPTA